MSDFIPMISSSPPPLDDTPTFDDWGNDDDDDDFGGFASASFPIKTQPTEKPELSSTQGMADAIKANHADDLATSKLSDNDTDFTDKHDGNISNSMSEFSSSVLRDGFGHFTTTTPPDSIGPFGDNSSMETAIKKTSDGKQMDDADVMQHDNVVCQSDVTQQDIANSNRTYRDDCCGPHSRQCSQDKVSRDSGVCSSEISPVTKSDEYQEFTRAEYNIDQFGTVKSDDESSNDAIGVADNGFGSGTTTPSIEPEMATDADVYLPESVPLSDCEKGPSCDENSIESSMTYQDVSAQIHGDAVISETVKGIPGADCDGDMIEHSSTLELDDTSAAVESALKEGLKSAGGNRTDDMQTERLPESNNGPEFCFDDPTLPADSISSELQTPGTEKETSSVKQSDLVSNSDHTNTFQEITTSDMDSAHDDIGYVKSDSDIIAKESGTKANGIENGRDCLCDSDTTKVAQSGSLGNGGEMTVINNDFSDFAEPLNINAQNVAESDIQLDQPCCIPPDENDDDFSNFSTAPEIWNKDAKSESNNHQEQPICVTQNDDSFGNFDAAADLQTSESDFDAFSDYKDSGTLSGESDWAAFHSGDLPKAMDDDTEAGWAAFHGSGNQTRTCTAGADKEDDFGDFEEAEFGSFAQKPPTPVSVQPVTLDIKRRMEAVLLQCFPRLQDRVDTGDVSSCLLIEVLMTELRRPLPNQHPASGRHKAGSSGTIDLNVWNRLKDIEETPALKYTWTASATSRQLLASIAVDPRNMLLPHKKQSSMPAFAADLGLLEPSRGSCVESTKSCDPIIVDTSKSPPLTATDPPPDIPPAEFDWNSSGLTNPLDARGCMHLELDFLVVRGHHGNSDITVTQSEALQKEQEILEAIETISPSAPVKILQPLESVLANMKFVSTAPSSVTTSKQSSTNLTEDATRVIERLPDLSFMHATVLMFPIKCDQ